MKAYRYQKCISIYVNRREVFYTDFLLALHIFPPRNVIMWQVHRTYAQKTNRRVVFHFSPFFFVFVASAFIAGSSGVTGSVSRSVQSGSTFLHSLIKLTNKTNNKLQSSSGTELESHLALFRALFNLLSNLALSAECRGVMWKVGWMTGHVIIDLCVHPLLLQDDMILQHNKAPAEADASRFLILPSHPTHKVNVNEPDHNPRYFMPFAFWGEIWVNTLSSQAGHVWEGGAKKHCSFTWLRHGAMILPKRNPGRCSSWVSKLRSARFLTSILQI